MQSTILIALTSISMSVVCGDSNKIRNFISTHPHEAELNLQRLNITNEDFNGLDVAPHITTINLSDNSFTGDFALSACLRAFPKLKTLTINNNQITGFAIEDNFRNETLQVLNAKNTDCVDVHLKSLYTQLKLETFDLSESKQLENVINPLYSCSNRQPLTVHLRNVVMGENLQKIIIHDSALAYYIKTGCATATTLAALPLIFTCEIFAPNYCMRGPILTSYESPPSPINWLNILVNSLGGGALALVIGDQIIGRGVGYCLPNHGKVTVIKYVTSSADEVV